MINTATVNSTDPDNKSVNNTDDCMITVDYNASIEIVKTASTNGVCPGSDPLAVYVGDNVTYCFNVTNTGNVSLYNLSLFDDHYGAITLGKDMLVPGESTGGNKTHTVTAADIPSVINTATVNSTDPNNKSVNDTDTCTLNVGYNASIEIVKTASTNGVCPGSDPLTVHAGDTVTYCFNVTNTGNKTLTNISLFDDHYGAITLGNNTLEPGKSLTNWTVTYTVTESDIPSVIINTATVNSTDPDNKSVNDTDTCTLNADYNASIEIEKTASISGSCPGSDPLTVHAGDTVTYCFNVTNTGNKTLTNISLFDDHYGVITLGNNTLEPGKSLTNWTVTYTVTESDIPSVIINIATVNSTDPNNKSVNDTDTCTLNADYNASIEIVKTASTNGVCPGSDPLTVHLGDNVTYCFNVTNTGNKTLTNISLFDDHYGVILLANTELEPGKSLTNWTVTYTVTESDIPSVIINTATVNSTDPNNKSVNDTDTCTLNADYNASIEIEKTASISGSCPGTDPLSVHIGDTVTYCFNVTNTGNVNLTGVTVIDNIYGSVTLANTSLAPGETTVGTITHIVVVSDTPSVTNTANATGTDPLGGSVTDTDPCTVNVEFGSGIHIDKTASTTGTCPGTDPLTVNISDMVTYCFSVTNTGNVTLTNISVFDDHYGAITPLKTELAPGESLTNGSITHTVTESDIPSVTNTVTVNSTDPDFNPVNDTDTCTLNVDYNANIEIRKTAYTSGSCPGSDPLSVDLGDTVIYCFNVTNTGNVTLTNVAVFDDHYGEILLANTELAPGESLTNWTITHTVTKADIPSVTNTATVNATDPDNIPVNAADNCTVAVEYTQDILIMKTASTTGTCPGTDPLTVDLGDTVTYCFNVTNTGNVTLTNISVTDDHYGTIVLTKTELAPDESTGGTTTHPVTEADVLQRLSHNYPTTTDSTSLYHKNI